MQQQFIRYFCILAALCLWGTTSVSADHTLTIGASDCSTFQTQSVPDGATIVLEAKPSAGNLFIRWNDGNTDNPRTITVQSDATCKAIFGTADEVLTTWHTLTISANACSAPVVQQVPDGATCELRAVPDAACGKFLQWSDGNTDNPRMVTITDDAVYTAEFAAKQFTITVTAEDSAQGAVSITQE